VSSGRKILSFLFAKKKKVLSQHGGVMRQGWLKKQGVKYKTWKRRWCVLFNDGCFKYFEDQDCNKQKKNDVMMNEIFATEQEGANFWVETEGRKWTFIADTESDAQAWIEVFCLFSNEIKSSQPKTSALTDSSPNSSGLQLTSSVELKPKTSSYSGLNIDFQGFSKMNSTENDFLNMSKLTTQEQNNEFIVPLKEEHEQLSENMNHTSRVKKKSTVMMKSSEDFLNSVMAAEGKRKKKGSWF